MLSRQEKQTKRTLRDDPQRDSPPPQGPAAPLAQPNGASPIPVHQKFHSKSRGCPHIVAAPGAGRLAGTQACPYPQRRLAEDQEVLLMLNSTEIMDTIHMIDQQHLDIRTITMGISCWTAATPTPGRLPEDLRQNLPPGRKLVSTGEAIEREFGIPIVNKRISVTPHLSGGGRIRTGTTCPLPPPWTGPPRPPASTSSAASPPWCRRRHRRGPEAHRRHTRGPGLTELVCSSVNVGSTKAGINMDAVALMGRIIKAAAERTADRGGFGCAKLVVFCNAVEDNPFMAGAFHGVGEGDCVINVGVSGPGVVYHALKSVKGQPPSTWWRRPSKDRLPHHPHGPAGGPGGQPPAGRALRHRGPLLAPTPAVGDSVARILEEMGLEVCGTHGTTAALALLNDAVKRAASWPPPTWAASPAPSSRERGRGHDRRRRLRRAAPGQAGGHDLRVFRGPDMIAVPGDTTAETLSAIIADEAAIGMVNSKTTAVRLIPAPGKTGGDTVEFGGLLGSAPVMPSTPSAPAPFVSAAGASRAPCRA